MEKRNTVLLTVIAVATLLVAVVGAAFAFFSANVQHVNQTPTVLESAQLGITFTGTKEVSGDSIEPGWSDTKKFTVENTSDYDMTFDINFTEIVNNFTRTQDLTYSVTAAWVTNGYQGEGNVQMVADGGSKSDFNVSGTLPQGGTVSSSDAGEVVTPAESPVKIVRVHIPAHAKQEFTITFAYANSEESQDVDQGKVFQTTVNITSNGIESGAEYKPITK